MPEPSVGSPVKVATIRRWKKVCGCVKTLRCEVNSDPAVPPPVPTSFELPRSGPFPQPSAPPKRVTGFEITKREPYDAGTAFGDTGPYERIDGIARYAVDPEAELIAEVQDWFAQNSPNGEIPEESTTRKKVAPIWRALRGWPLVGPSRCI